MDLQLDQLLFILRIVLVSLIYLFLILLIYWVVRDLAPPADPPGYLVVVDKDDQFQQYRRGQVFRLKPETTVGRGPTSTIILIDERISTTHMRLTHREPQWWVDDVGSSNGTFLNGERIGQARPVKPGDLLVLGPERGVVTFRFRVQKDDRSRRGGARTP
jgi:pSer/pThr/pTyr-binding forkhead associated (FHA) protein